MFKDSISVKKDHEGSRRLKEVQEGSITLKKAQDGPRGLKKMSRSFQMFYNIIFSWCFPSWECIPHVVRS